MKTPTDADAGVGLQGPPCLSDEAIEEYCVQSLGDAASEKMPSTTERSPVAMDIEGHLAGCADCRGRFETAKADAVLVRKALDLGIQEPAGECLSDEDLAFYLDDALKTDRRVEVEKHVARCAGCQRRLTFLYDEVRAVSTDTAEDSRAHSVSLAEARERLAAFKGACEDTPAVDGSATADSLPSEGVDGATKAEERKQRYSSQSS
jgi:hypothetical protein